MESLLIFGILIVWNLIQLLLFYSYAKDLRSENKDLLNRMMARDFSEYALGTKAMNKKPDEPVTERERYKQVEMEYLKAQQDADIIPVTG